MPRSSATGVMEAARARVRAIAAQAALGGRPLDKAGARRIANAVLAAISTHDAHTYYSAVPLDRIYDAVELAGFSIPDADKSCFLCGRDGRATWPLIYAGKDARAVLHLAWHKLDSGRYEVVAYVS